LVTEIYEAVLDEYRQKYPKSPADATVLLDEATGRVRIFSGEKDVTPTGWGQEAARVARQTVIARMSEGKPVSKVQAVVNLDLAKPHGTSGVLAGLVNLFFWGYNIYFALIIWLWALSAVRNIATIGVFRGLLMLILAITPVVVMGAAVKNKLWTSAGQLMKLFFLIELPVVLACLLPMSLMTQVTPFMGLVSLGALGVPVVLYFYGSEAEVPEKWLRVILGGQQMVLMLAGYLGLLLLYWVPVVVGGLARTFLGDLFSTLTTYPSGYGPTMEPVLGGLLSGAVGILILVLISGILLVPYLLIVVLWRAWNKTRQQLAQTLAEEQVMGTIGIWAAVIVTIGVAAAYQPTSARLVDALRKINTLTTFDAQEEAAAQVRPNEAKLKRIISDMQYARRKYLFTKDDKSLQVAYEDVFNLGSVSAIKIQEAFLTVAYPFVYQGERNDYSQLAANFQYVFGHGINEVKPVTPQEAKNVLLTYRKVTVKPEAPGAVATIAIEEEYDNQTNQQQEVIYEFSLPSGTVVTGLKLGADLEFPGVIAPKGAAQRTYEQQLAVRRDPALLEETGPGLYRLRVFPIPAKGDFNTLKGKRQKVEFTYATTATPDGYALPVIGKKTNVFTNTSTQWLLSTGERLKEDDRWVRGGPGVVFDPCQNSWVQSITSDNLTASIKSVAESDGLKKLACGEVKEAMQSINGAKIGIFYDVSTGNKDDQTWKELTKVLNEDKGFVSRNTVEVYKYNEMLSAPIRLTGEGINDVKLNYFGRSDVWKALISLENRYGMVLLITNSSAPWANGGYAFAPDTQVFVVHTGPIPAYSMPITSKIVQSRGNVVATVAEAMREYALGQELVRGSDGAVQVVSPYFGATFSGVDLGSQVPQPVKADSAGLQAVVNGALGRAVVAARVTDVSGDITILDQLNGFADAAQMVTPYSSLLALVNELQELQLEQWKQAYNRYQDQAIRENLITPPIGIMQPTQVFDTFGGSPLGDLIAPRMMAPGFSGGGGMMGIAGPTSMALDGGGGSFGGGVSSSTGLQFILVNGVLLAVGMGWYLVKILRKKH